MRRIVRGLTLAELVIVLAIVAVMATSVPTLQGLVSRTRTTAAMDFLYRLLSFARSQAVSSGHYITLCGTADGSQCTRRWDSIRVMVFYDRNNNKLRDNDEILLREAATPSGVFEWRGANRDYMRYRPDGSVVEFGTYTYCDSTSDNRHARQLTINHAGRAYRSRDRDKDGIHEANTGKRISCPSW